MNKKADKKVLGYMYDVIKSSVLTEKSQLASEFNKVTFKVANDASKPLIKQSVEAIFGVSVKSVNVVNLKGKNKVFRGVKGRRSDIKKAIVTLKEGDSINFSA